MITTKPSYMLDARFKWLLSLRHDKRAIKNMRNRCIKAFEYELAHSQFTPESRLSRIVTEIIERYWAVRYPEVIETPQIQMYDLSLRGGFWLNTKSLQVIHNLKQKSDFAGKGFFTKDTIKALVDY